MAVVTTNLGVITAYGDAVAAGYTGTKAQWQALMANYATVGQQAAQDAQTASQAAQTATTKAGEASQSATRAENAAASITTPDATLTQAGVAADAKTVGDELTDIKDDLSQAADDMAEMSEAVGDLSDLTTLAKNNLVAAINEAAQTGSGGTGGGVPSSVKGALITLLKAAVYSETGLTDEISTIESWASATAELVSISASYSGGTVRAGTSLDDLRSDLTVIATYQDSTTEVVTGYTLSGTLSEGTQTVTVSYGGKTDTFTVTVVSGSTLLNSWDFTQGLTDSVGGKVAIATATQNGTGLHFTAGMKYAEFPAVYAKDRTYEIDVASIQRTSLTNYGRLFMVDHDSVTGTGGAGYILTADKKGGDLFYIGGWESSVIVSAAADPDGSYYDDSTVGFYIDSTGKIHVYKDGTRLGASAGTLAASYDGANVYFGSSSNSDTLYNATFTGFRVYDGNKYGGA